MLNVAGHRLSTAEMEDAIIGHKEISEAAVVGLPDKLKGEVPVAFVKAKTQISDKEVIEFINKEREKENVRSFRWTR